MKVYLTYFRYDRDEDYSIYHIDLNKKSSIKHYLEKDLLSFLSYGPDDVSILTLQEVEMTKSDFNKLLLLYQDSEDSSRELIDFMIPIYDQNNDSTCLFYDSGDSIWELIDHVTNNIHLYTGFPTLSTDYDTRHEEVQDLLFDDDTLFETTLKRFLELL